MKICIVSDYLPSTHENWSGAELVASKTSEILSSRGHEISHIVLSSDKKSSQSGVYFIKSPLRKLPFLAKNFPIDFVAFIKTLFILNKIKPDVVHVQAKFLFFPSAVSAFFLKIPYLFTVLDYYNLCPRNILLRKNGKLCVYYHGVHCSDCVTQSSRYVVKKINFFFPALLKKPLFIFRKKIVDFFMNKAAGIITFSNTSRERLLAYGYKKNKVFVLYHYPFENIQFGINTSEPVENNVILFVGTITYHKGLYVLVKAMRDVVKKIPQVKLLIAGSGKGEYFNSIYDFIQKNNMSKNIDFLGHRSNKEILELMNKVSMVVVPEQWHSEFGPVILIEAKLANKVVVASEIGSIPEYIRNGEDGILFQHDLPDNLSKAILSLLTDKNMAIRMGKNLSARVKNVNDFKNTFSRLEDLYSSIKGSERGL